jgi:hypothetical protein
MELRHQLVKAKVMEGGGCTLGEQRAWLAKLEMEVEVLRVEKKVVLVVMDDTQKSYLEGTWDRKAQINLLNQDVDVHREQMESTQTMLEEMKMIASELHNQLEGATKDEDCGLGSLRRIWQPRVTRWIILPWN